MLSVIAKNLATIREKTPLVQAITNYVTINDCANILLCFGASPAMCEAKSEVEEFVGLISALYINIGTLTEEQYEASVLAVKKAAELNKPVVLDPVACGAISRKTRIVEELVSAGQITVIKGNMGEIKSLAGFAGKVRGVDSLDDGLDGAEACISLARKYKTIVAATGATDIVSDGEQTCLIDNGVPMLTLITGSGCMVGALTAAAVGACEDKYSATVASIMAMGLAGEKAAKAVQKDLPGSFRVKLFDSIYTMTEDDVLKGGKVRCL
ncbi:MAG TPA: hydroxyethylthiazole kinase [Syntrophomonadaceae bacterium]|nr:hydroxyethylthiazole kinase [Syntrophomonadaceae bacterium]